MKSLTLTEKQKLEPHCGIPENEKQATYCLPCLHVMISIYSN